MSENSFWRLQKLVLDQEIFFQSFWLERRLGYSGQLHNDTIYFKEDKVIHMNSKLFLDVNFV